MKKAFLLLAVFAFSFSACSKIPQRDNQKTNANSQTINSLQATSLVIPKDGVITTPKVDGFQQFRVKIPNGWTLTRFDRSDGVSIELGKDKYLINFIQPSYIGGGGTCVFPDDKQLPDGPYIVKYTKFISLKTSFGNVRMGNDSPRQGQSADSDFYTACSFYANTKGIKDDHMGLATSIGAIVYEIPTSYDKKILDEMNQIIQSIQIVK